MAGGRMLPNGANPILDDVQWPSDGEVWDFFGGKNGNPTATYIDKVQGSGWDKIQLDEEAASGDNCYKLRRTDGGKVKVSLQQCVGISTTQ